MIFELYIKRAMQMHHILGDGKFLFRKLLKEEKNRRKDFRSIVEAFSIFDLLLLCHICGLLRCWSVAMDDSRFVTPYQSRVSIVIK